MLFIDNLHVQEKCFHLVIFSIDDFDKIKAFVLDNCSKLSNPDFFIVDDLETELPAILENPSCVMCGLLHNNSIVSIQAVDFLKNNSEKLKNAFNLTNSPIFFAELGWTITTDIYRGMGVASLLMNYVEKFALEDCTHSNCKFAATVHPDNICALSFYQKKGYYKHSESLYYGVPRILLIKDT